jgi:hypothetical protein
LDIWVFWYQALLSKVPIPFSIWMLLNLTKAKNRAYMYYNVLLHHNTL